MRTSKISAIAAVTGALLAGCISPPTVNRYSGPPAPPQVVYRIDDHRYFMIEPRLNYACVRANLNYIDTKLGIRTSIPGWDRMEKRAELIIDASNDRYLVAPIAGMDSACAPDAHPARCVAFMIYSRDAGRTWEVTKQLQHLQYNGEVRLVGDTVYYAGHRARLQDLPTGNGAWTAFPLDHHKSPPLGKTPIDKKLQCDNSKTIGET